MNITMWGLDDDKELIRKALGGSERAWFKLIRRYESRVFNLAYRMTGNRQDALDLMQEAFLAAFRNLPNFRHDGPFPAWLLRITSHRSVDFIRRRRINPLHGADDVSDLEIGRTHVEQEAEDHQLRRTLIDVMKNLPVEQRQVVELKFFQGLTFEDIAIQIGIPANTAKTRLYSALKTLKGAKELIHAL